MTRLGTLTLIVTIILALGLGLMRFLGQPTAVPNIFESLSGCETNCWRGIHLGETTVDDAEQILRSKNPLWIGKPYGDTLYWEENSPSIKGQIADIDGRGKVKVIYLTLSNEFSFTLGTAVEMWGNPIAIKIQLCNSEQPPIMIYFKGNITVYAYIPKQADFSELVHPSIMPTTPIAAVEYADSRSFSMDETRPWNGFALIRPTDILPGYCG